VCAGFVRDPLSKNEGGMHSCRANNQTRQKCNDPYILAEATGLEIDFQPFLRIKGINICRHDVRILVINLLLPYHEKKFIAAYELGHHILHPYLNYFFITENTLFCNGKFEKEFNYRN